MTRPSKATPVGPKPKTYNPGRRCLSCSTILSRYNPSDYCHLHRPVRLRRLHDRTR